MLQPSTQAGRLFVWMHENNLLFKKYLVVLRGGVVFGVRDVKLEEQTPATHDRTRDKGS